VGARAVVFDVGGVLYHWDPRILYERLIADDRALDAFLANVVTREWHFQHDQGRPFAETSAELIARFPEHEALIAAWGTRFQESMGPAVAGMPELVVYAFNAILTTANTPRAIVDQLHQATLKVMADADMQDFLRKAGAEPVTDSSPDKTTRFLKDEIARWTPIINESGLKQ